MSVLYPDTDEVTGGAGGFGKKRISVSIFHDKQMRAERDRIFIPLVLPSKI